MMSQKAIAYLLVVVVGGSAGWGFSILTQGSLANPALAGEEEDPQDSMPIDWDNPIVNASVLRRPQDANQHLSFTPSVPESLGDPRRSLMTEPKAAADPQDRWLSLEYQHPQYGHFLALQSFSQTNDAELAAIAARCSPASGCEGTASIVSLRDGSPALILEGPTATSITWLRGTTRFDIIGPPEFTAAGAEEVANHF